jgi:hypothetical protein
MVYPEAIALVEGLLEIPVHSEEAAELVERGAPAREMPKRSITVTIVTFLIVFEADKYSSHSSELTGGSKYFSTLLLDLLLENSCSRKKEKLSPFPFTSKTFGIYNSTSE